VAANLLKAGLPVLVFDRNPAAVDKLVKLGAKAVGSPQEMGETPGKRALCCSTRVAVQQEA
jgi:3-hydroxyisobutyrate dehydrogenase